MSKDTYDFSDLDDILAEFGGGGASDDSPSPLSEETETPFPAPEEEFVPAPEETAAPVPPPGSAESTVRFELPLSSRARREAQPTEDDEPPLPPAPETAAEQAPARDPRALLPIRLERPPRPPKEPKPPKTPKPPKKPKEPKPLPVFTKRRIPGAVRALLSLIFFAAALALLGWTGMYLHPGSGVLSSAAADTKLRLSDKLDVYVNNAASDALGELSYIRKIYTLQEGETVAPAPDPNGYGMTYDPAEIDALIQKASFLLDGQTMTFDSSADFVPDEPIRWYLDDTIFVVAWKEYIEQRCCTFAEVKIAHGSQLRRKLVHDTYSPGVQLYASELANASNAVVASNADFYEFRDLGITVYQRRLYRNNPAQVDSCFFTASGDMLFTRAGELMGEGETQRFIDENDVIFSLAFGPVLVDNGELQYCSAYPIGEINSEYSRACIAMTDKLHYLLMTINWTDDLRPRATVNELARFIYSKNVQKAYTLDGGQTAEIVMMGAPINHVDYGNERAVSDIIYFATAVPEEVRP